MSINVSVLTGRLTRDPEARTTTSGKHVTTFTIAVDNITGKEAEKSASFFNVVAWENLGDVVAKFQHKGDLVGVTGRLSQRSYTDKDGNTRSAVEIIATEVQFLTPKKVEAEPEADPEEEYTAEVDEEPEVQPIRKPMGKPAYVKPAAQPAPTAKKK